MNNTNFEINKKNGTGVLFFISTRIICMEDAILFNFYILLISGKEKECIEVDGVRFIILNA